MSAKTVSRAVTELALPPLTRYGRSVDSVFDLLGRNEVALTAAFGWCLTRSPLLMAHVWKQLGMPGNPGDVSVALEVADGIGRTDLELVHPLASVIVEAKKGWLVPGESQLAKYAHRIADAPTSLLVSLSDSSAKWAEFNLPSSVGGSAVRHLPWDEVRSALAAARAKSRVGPERMWLSGFNDYLAGATSVRNPEDQWVYCVVVTDEQFGSLSTFRDFVRERRVYFHAFGGVGGWPKRPPTFLSFRWGGQVRQVNRVLSHEVVPHLGGRFADVADAAGAAAPHIVYELGPDIPIPTIRTQGTYASGRVWALLDQLLTSPTLKDACDRSKQIDPS